MGAATRGDLERVFHEKHGSVDQLGWAPRRRLHAGYFMPADVYEATVDRLVTAGCRWLDIGGGSDVFPHNPTLARRLVSQCAHVVAVDPSPNVDENPYVHERVRSRLEDYRSAEPFDLATMRMVAEHVEDPASFVGALAGHVKPGGHVIVFTVSRWSPVTVVSRAMPFKFHHLLKRMFWGGDEEDTFPTHYRMNTRRELSSFFTSAGFVESSFMTLDDLSVFSKSYWLNAVELGAWRLLQALGLGYPERCLLAIYQKR